MDCEQKKGTCLVRLNKALFIQFRDWSKLFYAPEGLRRKCFYLLQHVSQKSPLAMLLWRHHRIIWWQKRVIAWKWGSTLVMEDSDSKQICARGTAKGTHSMRVYKIIQRIGVWDYLLMSTEKEETMRLQWGSPVVGSRQIYAIRQIENGGVSIYKDKRHRGKTACSNSESAKKLFSLINRFHLVKRVQLRVISTWMRYRKKSFFIFRRCAV